jgi:hypothetical protein
LQDTAPFRGIILAVYRPFICNWIISMLILVNFPTNNPDWKDNGNINISSLGFLFAIATTIKSIFARLASNHGIKVGFDVIAKEMVQTELDKRFK